MNALFPWHAKPLLARRLPSLHPHTPRHFSMQQIKELFPCQQCLAEEDELQRTRILLLLLLAGFWDVFHQLGGVCGVDGGGNVSFKYNKMCWENKEQKKTSSRCPEERKEWDRIFPDSRARLCSESLGAVAVPAAPMPQDPATGCSHTLRQQRTAKSTSHRLPQSFLPEPASPGAAGTAARLLLPLASTGLGPDFEYY